MSVYEKIARFLPKRVVESFKREIEYVGLNVEETRFVGFLITFGIALSFGIALNLFVFFGIPIILSFLFFSGLSVGGTYLWLSITSESKGKFVEKILPDALQLIAANIKAGLTTERALFVSARPEFGPLEVELKAASRKILTGQKVETTLAEMGKKIRSKTFERTFWLINRGISSGGQIGDLLIQLSDDLREQNALQDEVRANISIYVLLILVSAAFFAPIMFGISSFITQVLNKRISLTENVPFSLGLSGTRNIEVIRQAIEEGQNVERVIISPDFITTFALSALAVTILFASLIIGIINTGKEKQGAKYIPFLLVLVVVIFLVVRQVMLSAFSQLV